jgi:hypothetical protein
MPIVYVIITMIVLSAFYDLRDWYRPRQRRRRVGGVVNSRRQNNRR